jgi:hypothetical protein
VEPTRHGTDGGEEDDGNPHGTADALGQQELVVLRRDGRHHQAEHVHERTAYQEQPHAVPVVDAADDGAQYGHEEDLQRWDP